MNQNYTLKTNETNEYHFKNSDTTKLDLLKLPSSKFHLLHQNNSFDVVLEDTYFKEKEYSFIKFKIESSVVKMSRFILISN